LLKATVIFSSEGFQSVLTIGKWLMQLIHYLEEFIQSKLKI
jgi:hypothetical protein